MYQSPFRVINADALPQEPEALRRMLSLEKKKLLAEFELAGSASITIAERELDRQDVLALFEELGNERRRAYHFAIWQDQALLGFLEEGRMGCGNSRASAPLHDEAGFLTFVSPHFAAACNAFMRRALAGAASADEVQAAAQVKWLLLPADSGAAYRHVTRFFTEKKNELLGIRHRADSDGTVSVAEIRAWCTDDQIHLLNCLPDTFASLRYTLANTLNNLCVAYDRKKANRHALAAIERAATIRMDDEELRQLIPGNLRIIRSKQSRTWYNTDPATGRKTPRVGLVIILIIIIIRIATAGSGCERGIGRHTLPAAAYDEPAAGERLMGGGDSLFAPLFPPATTRDSDRYSL
jgi:hypothetical protein